MEYISVRDIPRGDGYSFRYTALDIPATSPVTKAWMTVKADTANADPGVFQKVITTTNVPGMGQIEDDGAVSGQAVLRFDLTPANTVLLKLRPDYDYFDVQLLIAGVPTTPIGGDIGGLDQVTGATS